MAFCAVVVCPRQQAMIEVAVVTLKPVDRHYNQHQLKLGSDQHHQHNNTVLYRPDPLLTAQPIASGELNAKRWEQNKTVNCSYHQKRNLPIDTLAARSASLENAKR